MNSDLHSTHERPARRFTDEAASIRVSDLYRRGVALRLPFQATFEEGAASVGVTLIPLETSVECNIVFQWPHSPDVDVEFSLRVSRTTLPSGGRRVWLHCLACERRASSLYIHDHYLVCDKCAELRYRSRHNPSVAKALRLARLRAPLATPNSRRGMLARPKGMHRTTFERRLHQIRELES